MTQRPLVLLVDDYADTRELYGSFLSMHGYRTEEAEDGLEAVAKAATYSPAVILMDLAMPVLDGWSATALLKKGPRTSHIPVICLTAHHRTDEQNRAVRAGCDGFLTKPCLPGDVLREIERVVGGAAGSRGTPS